MGDTFSSTKKILEREAAEKAKKEEAEAEERRLKTQRANATREDNRLAWKTHFSMKQVVDLHNAFREQAAQSPDPNEVTSEQFHEILKAHNIERGNNGPYLERLFEVFDDNESGTINFNEFILALSVVTKGSAAEKFKLSFDIYDIDKTGSIDKEEMRQVLTKLNSFAREHDQAVASPRANQRAVDVNKLVDDIFQVGDRTGNGRLTYPEYFKACQKMPWLTEFDVPPAIPESQK